MLAGYDTTAFSIAAGMQALCEQSGLLRRLQENPDLIGGFVDECVRWETPERHFMRTAMADTSLRGSTIAAGDWLMLCYPSGNRDEEVFDAPFEFRPDRPSNPHLAFGHGAHKCLGMHLARLEMSTFWKLLLPRLDAVELAGAPMRSQSIFITGLKRLPIRYCMR
jgi:cytochrome P450